MADNLYPVQPSESIDKITDLLAFKQERQKKIIEDAKKKMEAERIQNQNDKKEK
jgi:hypothetical protein